MRRALTRKMVSSCLRSALVDLCSAVVYDWIIRLCYQYQCVDLLFRHFFFIFALFPDIFFPRFAGSDAVPRITLNET